MSTPPNQMPNLSTDPALASIGSMAGPLQGQLQDDTQSLEGLNSDVKSLPQFEGQEPLPNQQGMMSSMPLLIGLATVGGKLAGVHAKTMLEGINGMTKGTIQGNQQAYTEAKQRYDDSYTRWLDKHKAMLQVYNEMRQVYKGRVDADLRALEIARKAVGDDAKIDEHSVKNWQWEQDYARKLEEDKRKQDESRAHIDQMEASADKSRATAANAAGGGQKAKDHAAAVQDAGQLIDQLIALAQKKTTIGPGMKAPVTGLGGKIGRVAETIGNVTGLSSQTTAHDFESKLNSLKLKLPKLLTGASKSAKDERAQVDSIARGTKLGDTPENTVSALNELKKLLGGMKIVRTGKLNGRPVVQFENGSTAYAD